MTATSGGLLRTTLPLKCKAGHEFSVAITGMHVGCSYSCEQCEDHVAISSRFYNGVRQQVGAFLNSAMVENGGKPIPQAMLNFIIMHNRVPTIDEYSKPVGYPVNLVAEQFYQSTIRGCRVGEAVTLYHEVGNPHDQQAVIAVDERDQAIGYVPRDSFIQRVVHKDRKCISATILAMFVGKRGFMEVVLDAQIQDDPTATKPYISDRRQTGCEP